MTERNELLDRILNHADRKDGTLVVTRDGAGGWFVQYGHGWDDAPAGSLMAPTGYAFNTHELDDALRLVCTELEDAGTQ